MFMVVINHMSSLIAGEKIVKQIYKAKTWLALGQTTLTSRSVNQPNHQQTSPPT